MERSRKFRKFSVGTHYKNVIVKVKSLPSHLSVPISVSLDLSQTPAYTAIAHRAVYLFTPQLAPTMYGVRRDAMSLNKMVQLFADGHPSKY